MVIQQVEKTDEFVKCFQKINDQRLKEKVQKQIIKIVQNPETGKPMRFARKGTREVHIPPFRLSYAYIEDKIIFLDLYHKDEQ
jgi:mRNA-degrading endonuclease RelE of RelBE toxin-antitoxin system